MRTAKLLLLPILFLGCATAVLAQFSVRGINNGGDVTFFNVVRDRNGNTTVLNVPNTSGAEGHSINNAGDVAGHIWDTSLSVPKQRGFVWERSETVTIFDAPNAIWTEVTSINDAGDVTGYFVDGSQGNNRRAFERDCNGNFIVFDVPNKIDNDFDYRFNDINNRGVVTGTFLVSKNPDGYVLTFVRDQNGNFTVFDAPDGFQTCLEDFSICNGTTSSGINDRGDVVGTFWDSSPSGHKLRGFIRNRNGEITIFDPPNSGFTSSGFFSNTFSYSINNSGDIAGYFWDAVQNKWRSFVRDWSGNFTVFDAPNASWTFATSINDNGDVAGNVDYGVWVGFVRDRKGNFAVFDACPSCY